MAQNLKKILLDYCYEFVQLKQQRLQSAIEDAQSSLSSESQSTAGDKHDTSRAMMHLEIEKKSTQLSEIEKLKRVLNQIDVNKSSKTVGLGTVIVTNKGAFFISINGGKHQINNTAFTIISLASPLAQRFRTAETGSEIQVMNTTYQIQSIN